jgi:hypothetical protein
MAKTKIKKLEDEVKDATNKADQDVERANQSYHEFMSYYSDYQSDLKRRGHVGGLRKGSEAAKEGNRQSENSDKETKETDS